MQGIKDWSNWLFLPAVILVTMFLVACQRHEEPPSTTSPPVTLTQKSPAVVHPGQSQASSENKPEIASSLVATLLNNPIKPLLVEEQAEALPVWRRFAKKKPALLLFSGRPLKPLTEAMQVEVDLLLQHGDDQEVVRRVARPVPDQLLSPSMGVAAAMRQRYFSRVIWVVPVEGGMELLPLVDFKQGLRQRAAGWGDDIDSFKVTENGAYSGVLGGVSVDVVSIDRLPIVKEPLLVHIDSGFFTAIYRNEVRTPLYPLLTGHFQKVATRDYRTLGVTVSRDNLSFDVPLLMRFLGDDVAAFVADPRRLDSPSAAMKIRGEMCYLDSFFQPEVIIEKAQAIQKLLPRDADSFYRQYRARRQLKQLDQGLLELEKAVSLDPLYALEYFELINLKTKQGEKEAALAMIEKAMQALPDHALIGLRKAELLIEMRRSGEAVPLLNKLKQQPWSEFHYSGMLQEIDSLLTQARQKD